MIVADTGAIIALVDADDRHHSALLELYEKDPDAWILPWAILPEVDYLVGKFIGIQAQEAFLSDLSQGLYRVEWGEPIDLRRANELALRYRDLKLGLVDAVVMAVTERTKADTIATVERTSLLRSRASGRAPPRAP